MKKFIKYFLSLSLVIACMFCITACGEKQPELTSITATIDENYTVYLFDEIDASKISVKAKYSDDKEEVVQSSDLELGEFDTSIAGEQELKITYKGKETTLKINVSSNNKYKVDGFKPTFVSTGMSPYWKVKLSKTGEWKYFLDEDLKNEVTKEELTLPAYAVKNASITKKPSLTACGLITLTTTTDEEIKISIPNLNENNLSGYYKISKSAWTKDDFYAYKLNLEDLEIDWWESSYYEDKNGEYKIKRVEVDKIRPSLESLEIITNEKAPANSTKFVIEKVGSIKLDGENTSRVVISGKLLYGQLASEFLAPDCFSLYFKGQKTPYVENIGFKSFEVLNEETNEYKIVTKFYTASNNVNLGQEGIYCDTDDRGSLNGIFIKPGDEIVTTQRDKFVLRINSINQGEEMAKGDIISINKFPCKIIKINDITNNKELDKVKAGNDAVIDLELEILNYFDINRYLADDKTIRTGEEVEIWAYKDDSLDLANKQIATGRIITVKSKIKADIEVNGTFEIKEGNTIENLVPGDMLVTNLTNLGETKKIGIGKIISVPNAATEDNIYKDVIIEIDTTSLAQTLPKKEENYLSIECVDFLNACLSPGEIIKVYDTDKNIVLTITIKEYNFD